MNRELRIAPLNAKGHQAPLTSPASAPDSSSQVEAAEKMDWFAAWWPVVPVDQVDLLGLKLVVWADSQGRWHTLQDRCPHREQFYYQPYVHALRD
ncbi:rieske domain-containing protein [Haematococcus lacustris]|uniref:Rieske domain-containing protein n=1 Tax=Haematococcus lacustris TaxID=44745 RepID=A0A699YR33_HAELA|nr:rieske domain-containing protein [Haematococcus lacustris]